MKRLPIALLILLSTFTSLAAANDHNVLFFNNIARPLGMGGAYTAVPDFDHNHLYNPAAVAFPRSEGMKFSWSFDLIRSLYFLIELADSSSLSSGDDIEWLIGLSLILGTSQLAVCNQYFALKFNPLEQLPTKAADGFPMHVSTFSLSFRLSGPLRGFQLGSALQLYNLFKGDGSPSGIGFSGGLYYRPRDLSPFSFGIYYFTAEKQVVDIRRPFERILNKTFNAGAAYKIPGLVTLSFDLRNLNRYDEGNYLQPHLGVEKMIMGSGSDAEYWALILRGGGYYNSSIDSAGYSFGVGFRLGGDGLPNYSRIDSFDHRRGYFHFAYSLTAEPKADPPRYNHIISLGMNF